MIKLVLSCKHKTVLDFFEQYLQFLFKEFKLSLNNIIIYSLPLKIEKITLLNSPHVNKRSKDSFELRTYTKIYVFNNKIDTNFIKHIVFKKPKTLKLKIIY